MSRSKSELGNQYGNLKVVGRAPNQGTAATWKCQCGCGEVKIVSGGNLRSGSVRSCGCLAKKNGQIQARRNAPKNLNLKGKRFGRLIAISPSRAKREMGWLCQCDCGKQKVIATNDLTSEKITSCGCGRYNRETVHSQYGNGSIEYRRYVKYKIHPDEYNKMLEKQDGKCAICEKKLVSQRDTHLDHDHKCCPGRSSCGKCIRGILCRDCNLLLGNAEDNIKILKSAIQYLKVI